MRFLSKCKISVGYEFYPLILKGRGQLFLSETKGKFLNDFYKETLADKGAEVTVRKLFVKT